MQSEFMMAPFLVSIVLFLAGISECAVVPPPWANPAQNPCASKPGGWQMLFWPGDGLCYQIFKLGYPCPATMELTPSKNGKADCRCPPKTLRLWNATDCFPIFSKGPCKPGEFFTPDPSKPASEYRLGTCVRPNECSDSTQTLWPADGRCYRTMSRGPCPTGQLFVIGNDGVSTCSCSSAGITSGHVWEVDGRCYELYSRGPCKPGEVFLPGGKCGCEKHLPQYNENSTKCYEIGSIGPCNRGQRFTLSSENPGRAQCTCKPFNILWSDGACYRLYTRGPCNANELLTPSGNCLPLPCRKSRLYFPEHRRCFKIGTQGPCKEGEVVLFDFEARPSIDGLSYNGVCGCAGMLSLENPNGCSKTQQKLMDDDCAKSPGMAAIDGKCYMLYTKGPCGDGQWLIPNRNSTEKKAVNCDCKPGFTKYSVKSSSKTKVREDTCIPPVVSLARYLSIEYGKGS